VVWSPNATGRSFERAAGALHPAKRWPRATPWPAPRRARSADRPSPRGRPRDARARR
jgi:hypothetical protein